MMSSNDMVNKNQDMEVNFEAELEKYLNFDFDEFQEGSIISGKVVKITPEFVLVDVNYKSEGQIPVAEFMDVDGNLTVKEGDEVEVLLIRKNDVEGSIYLSYERARKAHVLDSLEQAFEKGESVRGKIIKRIKGGYQVDLGGLIAFLPGSHVDLRPVPDMNALVGQSFDFKIVKINRRRSNVIVSRRILLEEERNQAKEKLLNTLSEGDLVKGKVKNITDYGVFIDLGGLDGLLHITDMSWKRLKHPKEMVSLGDELELKILSFDKEEQKVSLGLKQLTPNPWENIEEKYPLGTKLKGVVTSLTEYGAFVELEDGVEGLVHVTEMSWTRKLKHPSQMVKEGDEVEVVVLDLDKEKKRLSLGMKQVYPNPWDIVAEKYPEGTILEAPIKNITEFGLFIGIEEGIDGLIHVSDLSWTKKIRHPGDLYKVGDVVRAKVLTVDKENQKFTLGIKQLTEDPWLKVPEKYPSGTTITGTVTNVTEFGLFVEVEEGIEGLVHVSELSTKKVKDPREIYKEGQQVTAKVLNASAEERRLGLSIKQWMEEEEKKRAEELKKKNQNAGGSNLGEILRQKLEENEQKS
ncbi:MAG: small subunit ribosomal protein [Desulfonauticus sp.]|jgi:small subunit ribosomal protein S1|nr:MAG: 30S ribosomal protein S1 [Desulfonauticus sp. 38_4375]MDK2921371.1 small subunit ribosomal protein [Desulfonauticus sp.]